MHQIAQKLNLLQIFICLLIFLSAINVGQCGNFSFWENPGCHLVGHIRKIRIPKCVEFEIRTNACRGYCISYAIPSSKESISINPNQKLTSVSQCCSIMDTEDVKATIMCEEGPKELVFKSARTCSCFHCSHA